MTAMFVVTMTGVVWEGMSPIHFHCFLTCSSAQNARAASPTRHNITIFSIKVPRTSAAARSKHILTPKCYWGHSMSSYPNFQNSDPRMKLSICEAKIMISFVDFFKILKT
jgi:hypothetical protein